MNHIEPNNEPRDSDAQTDLWIGRLTVKDCVRVVRDLALQVEAWHQSNVLHRAICLESIEWSRVDDAPRLTQPDEAIAEFGGLTVDMERCPPELRGANVVPVSQSVREAQQSLLSHGLVMAPQRIDVYQLGTLLCRLVCGQPVRNYLSSPATMSQVPKLIRHLIDRCIGYDESTRLETAQDLADCLAMVLEEQGLSGERFTGATAGSGIVPPTEARNRRRVPPFRKLGHFDVLDEIGHGGMGVVYRGYDRSLDRPVALKVLHPRFSDDPTFVKRFKAEAAAAAKLNHPHLVPIFFIGEDEGRHFYVMQFIDGESLAERLHRVQRLSFDEVLAIMHQVLTGLAAAHRQGFVHRDIKPGNILLDQQNGFALLTDFGLARGPQSDEPGESKFVMGTAEYMSPEQAQGDPVDARSDLYSVGIVLYQLLSGRMPFDANTPSKQLFHHVSEPPKPLRLVAPDVDVRMIRTVDRLLMKRPQDRFQSVEELLVELQSLSPHGPPSFVGSAAIRTDAGRRRPWLKINLYGSVAAIVATVLLVALVWQPQRLANALSFRLTEHRDAIWALSFDPRGKFVVSSGGQSASLKAAGDTRLRVWDASTGRLTMQSEPLPVGADVIVVSEDSQEVLALATAREDASLFVNWDLATGRQTTPKFDHPFAYHFDAVPQPNGIAIAVGNQGIVQLSPQPNFRRAFASPVRAICHNRLAANPLIYVSTEVDGQPTVISLHGFEFEESWRLTGFNGPVTALETYASMLVTRETDLSIRTNVVDRISLWNTHARKRVWTNGPYQPGSRGLDMSHNGKRIIAIAESVRVSGDDAKPQSAVVLDAKDGREICRLQTGSSQLTAVAISPDGQTAALGDASGRVVFSRLP